MNKGGSWEKEEVYFGGDDFFSRLQQECALAQQSIDFEVYIFENDALGEKILIQLQNAASRGVRVRLLVDGFGSFHSARAIEQTLKNSRVQFRIYNPLPRLTLSFLLPWKLWRYLNPKNILEFFGKINRRNHRKVCVVDGRVAYVGGMNVSAVHSQKYFGKRAWRDTSARVEGEPVIELSSAFQRAWTSAQERFWKLKKLDTNSLVRLNDTSRKKRRYHHDLINRILHAEKHICITNPYFVPDFFLLRALRLAAWSGVDVRILLPKRIDVFFMKWVNRAFYWILLKAGVRIFEYLPSTLHAKVVIIDEWAILGSSNRNHRSLIHDLEVDLVLTRPTSLLSLHKRFLQDLSQSKEISFKHWRRRHWLHNQYEKILLTLKHWL